MLTLVACASKHGATRGIAERIAERLTAAGTRPRRGRCGRQVTWPVMTPL